VLIENETLAGCLLARDVRQRWTRRSADLQSALDARRPVMTAMEPNRSTSYQPHTGRAGAPPTSGAGRLPLHLSLFTFQPLTGFLRAQTFLSAVPPTFQSARHRKRNQSRIHPNARRAGMPAKRQTRMSAARRASVPQVSQPAVSLISQSADRANLGCARLASGLRVWNLAPSRSKSDRHPGAGPCPSARSVPECGRPLPLLRATTPPPRSPSLANQRRTCPAKAPAAARTNPTGLPLCPLINQ
jgi:hypothetical protein